MFFTQVLAAVWKMGKSKLEAYWEMTTVVLRGHQTKTIT